MQLDIWTDGDGGTGGGGGEAVAIGLNRVPPMTERVNKAN